MTADERASAHESPAARGGPFTIMPGGVAQRLDSASAARPPD